MKIQPKKIETKSARGLTSKFFTTPKTDRHLLRQEVHQRISVMKTNNDIINDNPFLTL